MKNDFIYIHPLDFHPESSMVGTMRTRATRDERQVCGKKPILIQVCAWDCSKSKNKDKDCCVAKRKHEQDLAKWEKCIQEVRNYNLSVATSQSDDTSMGDNTDTSTSSSEDTTNTSDKTTTSDASSEKVKPTRPELPIGGTETTAPKNYTKIIVISVIVVLLILATFVGYKAFKKG